MSQPHYMESIPTELWALYETWCKAEGVEADLSQFTVWLSDQNIDWDEPDYA